MESINLLSKAEKHLPELIRIRQYLHTYPELSFQEYNTQAFLKRELKAMGLTEIEEIADTGLAVHLKSNSKGPCIALRADMDALSIEEANATEYASKNKGVMHACGHDVHMASLMGALKLLNENKSSWKGKILAIFQPGEELLPGGATKVISTGILGANKARLIIGQHVMPGMPAGQTGFRPGPYMASTDEIYININGKGGHAATPGLTRDTISCAAEMILSLREEIQRMGKDIPVIISIGRIEAPGSTNVIPSEVKMQGTFRTMDESFRKYAKEQMQSILKRIAERYGTEVELIIKNGYPSLVNNSEYTTEAMEYMQELLGSKNVSKMDIRMTGEDFAYYSQNMPAVFYRLGIAGEKLGHVNVHNRYFDIDDRALLYGASGLAHLAIKFSNQMKG